MRGPNEFRERQYAPLVAAFPDIRVEVESVIAQGDQVAVRWSASGIHSGDGLGFPQTNEPVTFRGISWIQVRDGKLMEGWQSSNITEVVRGLAAKSSG
jgi:predicted ester cyclase